MAGLVTPTTYVAGVTVTAAMLTADQQWYGLPRCDLTASKATVTATAVKPGSGDWTEVIDWDGSSSSPGMHDPVNNPTRVTIALASRFRVIVSANYANTTGGTVRSVRLYKNGTLIDKDDRPVATANMAAIPRIESSWQCAAADYFEVELYQDSGSGITVPVKWTVIWEGVS